MRHARVWLWFALLVMAAVASPDCLLSQPVAGLNSGSHFIGKGEWMLEKGGGFMARQ